MRKEHTPGPWGVEANTNGYRIRGGKDYSEIVDYGIFGADVETAEANANLIAAAPSLLESVKALTERAASMAAMLNSLGYPVYYADAKGHIEAAREITRKVEGER
jgi:hypothetical protein